MATWWPVRSRLTRHDRPICRCRKVSAPGIGRRPKISRATTAVAITVSESTGTVRLFQNGEVMLRIEPFRRAMKWIDFDTEPTSPQPGR